MKKQVKSSLFAVAVGLSLSSAMLFNASPSTAAHQPQVLKAQPAASPVAANTTAKPSQLPATFFLTLISCMAHGGAIDANIFIPERQASIWDDESEWLPER
ncbi:MAG: hypothetical protein KAX50_01495 [Saprospiraceae bacterium]|nr:hypothetical protein [Saprospiraceae bacterium]